MWNDYDDDDDFGIFSIHGVTAVGLLLWDDYMRRTGQHCKRRQHRKQCEHDQAEPVWKEQNC